MSNATMDDIAKYMRLLLESLAHLHDNRIIHRDVKPSNFLFSKEELGSSAVLLDFGLAQFEDPNYSNDLLKVRRSLTEKKTESIGRLRETLERYPPGYIVNDPRQPMKASRAGTRGFRAPEVLFKVTHQSCSIDVWSAGVILLTLITRRYPFFQSNDDQDAIVEIACILGGENMEKVAAEYHRSWKSNIPAIPAKHIGYECLVSHLNPGFEEELRRTKCVDLLHRLLEPDVKKRISAEDALEHPFLQIN